MYYLEDNNGLYAFVIVSNESDKVGHFIHFMEVKECHRRKGVGKKLLQFLYGKYGSLWFWPRLASHRFYLKQGAKPFITHSGGWLFAINDRLPTENWTLPGAGNDFCPPPSDDFVYDEEDWPQDFSEKCT